MADVILFSHARGLLLRIIVTLETYSVCTKYSLHTFKTYKVQFTYI